MGWGKGQAAICASWPRKTWKYVATHTRSTWEVISAPVLNTDTQHVLSFHTHWSWTVHPLTISPPSAADEGRWARVCVGGNLITALPFSGKNNKYTSVSGCHTSFYMHKTQVVQQIREFTSHDSTLFTRGYKALKPYPDPKSTAKLIACNKFPSGQRCTSLRFHFLNLFRSSSQFNSVLFVCHH